MINTITENSKSIEITTNGKLLISGEYFVLDGAMAFALPCKFGQRFLIDNQESEFKSAKKLHWQAYTKQNMIWLDVEVDLNNFTLINNSSNEAKMLLRILEVCKELNPIFLSEDNSVHVQAKLEFPRSWGLGSSSTLIYFMAKWAQINPYELLERTFGGSGYDIACAGASAPLVYTRNKNTPHIEAVPFNPSFKDKIFFVHLNEKMNSRSAIQYYKNLELDKGHIIDQLNTITKEFCTSTSIEQFESCMIKHEDLLSSTLAIDKVKDAVFSDYWGAVKSLGAWGGDFVMMTNASRSSMEFNNYLHERGFNTILSYDEMVIS